MRHECIATFCEADTPDKEGWGMETLETLASL
jgi:hypothetical protein